MRYSRNGLVMCLAGVLLAGDGIRHAARAAGERPAEPPQRRVWGGAYGASGTSKRLWSVKEYQGYKTDRAGLFREVESFDLVPLPVSAQWSVRYELRVERLSGTIELEEAQVLPEKRTGGPYRKSLDSYWQVAGLCVPRLVLFPDSPVRPSLHVGFGLSLMNKKIIEDGTLYNYNLLGGAGLEADVSKRWSVFADCRLEHYSNGGRMYLTNKTAIGLESVSGVVGVRREF